MNGICSVWVYVNLTFYILHTGGIDVMRRERRQGGVVSVANS